MNLPKYTLFIMLLWTSFGLRAQCVVDAGPDLTICTNFNGIDTTQIQASILSGTAPYTVRWETLYIGCSVCPNITATYFLDDTTQLQPNVVSLDGLPNGEWQTFYLYVEDSTGANCLDSIRIRFSRFGIVTISPTKFINQGDSTILYRYAGGGIGDISGNYTNTWTPNYNISDTTIDDPTVWPDSNTVYMHRYTDSVGCYIDSPWWVYVAPTAVKEMEIPIVKSGIFIDYPILRLSIENQNSNPLYMKIIDLNGRVIKQFSFNASSYDIDASLLAKGLYYYIIQDEKDKPISKGSFINP